MTTKDVQLNRLIALEKRVREVLNVVDVAASEKRMSESVQAYIARRNAYDIVAVMLRNALEVSGE